MNKAAMEGAANNSDVIIPVPPYWDLPWTIILSTTMIIFMSCAIVGNTMVLIVVFRHHGMRTRTNMFLCNLAVADLLCALICMPVSLVTVIKGQWIFSDVFCQFNGFIMPLFFVSSIHTLMYTSVHKYISISRPFSHILTRKRVLFMIAAAWVWAILTGYVTVHGFNHVKYKPYTTQCGPEYPQDLRTYMHPLYIISTCYLIPFGIIFVCYALVFREIRAHTQRLEKNTNQEPNQIFLQQRRITFTLFLVLLAFVLSWTPYIVYSVYASILKDKKTLPAYMNAVAYWFGYMNSAVNPFIYALRSPAFREGFKEIICQGGGVIVSEETEPYDSPSALRRFRTFLRHTLTQKRSSSTTLSQSVSRKESMTSVANLVLHSYRRHPSTNSLPESFKFRTLLHPQGKVGRGRDMGYNRQSSLVYYPSGENSNQKLEEIKINMDMSVPFEEEKPLLSNGCANQQQDQGRTDNIDVDYSHPECATIDAHGNAMSVEACVESHIHPGYMNYEDDNVFVVVADTAAYSQEDDGCNDPGSSQELDKPRHSSPRVVITPSEGDKSNKSSESDSLARPGGNALNEHKMKTDKEEKEGSPPPGRPGILRRLISWPHRYASRASSTTSHHSDVENTKTSKAAKPSSSNAYYLRSVSDDPWPRPDKGENSNVSHESIRKATSDTEVLAKSKTKNCPKSVASLKMFNKGVKTECKSQSVKERTKYVSGSRQKESKDDQVSAVVVRKQPLMRFPSIEKLDKCRIRHSKSTPARRKHRPKSEGNTLDVPVPRRHCKAKRTISHESELKNAELRIPISKDQLAVVTFEEMKQSIGRLQRSASDPCLTFTMIKEKVERKKQSRKSTQRSKHQSSHHPADGHTPDKSGKHESLTMLHKRSTLKTAGLLGKGSPDSGISTSLSADVRSSTPCKFGVSAHSYNKPSGMGDEYVQLKGQNQIKGEHYNSVGSLDFTPKTSRWSLRSPQSAMKKAHSEKILAHLGNPFKRWSLRGFYTQGEGMEKETCV